MNDQQLETVLRRSLSQHADTVDSGPTWPPEPLADDVLAEHRDRRRRPATWWPVAAAVVAVLAVIAVVLAVRHAASDHNRPATPVTVTRTACTTSLPQAWQDAIDTGALHKSDLDGPVIGGSPDGDVLISSNKQVTLFRPDGSTQAVSNVPFQDMFGIPDAAIDRRWIVLPTTSAVSGGVEVTLELIDRTTLRSREIAVVTDANPRPIALLDNHVYWFADTNAATGSVSDYDIGAGTTRTLTRSAKRLVSSSNGVAWTDARDGSHVIAGLDPTAVPGQTGVHPQLMSDGHNYAWRHGTDIAWYSDITKRTVVVQHVDAAGDQDMMLAVVGPYVIVQPSIAKDIRAKVVDTRTGAIARLDDTTGWATSGGGILAYTRGGSVIVRTQGLLGLHC